jgi:alpha-glucosidase
MEGNELATGFWPAFSYPALSPAVSRLVFIYFFIVLIYAVSRYFWLRPKSTMTRSFADGWVILNLVGFTLWSIVYAKAIAVTSISPASKTTTSWRPIFTVPVESNNGANLIPNILDPDAIDPQSVCPGYRASNVKPTHYGITADLTIAGKACNVYGTDIDNLILTIEHQSNTRLHIEITPKYLGAANSTWFILPEVLIPKPSIEGRGSARFASDLDFTWSNTPTFSFTVTRQSTGDVLFTTNGTKLVFENQFIEIGTPLPENYNLYGLGEAMHGFRMGNDFTRSFWAADAGDPIDGNIYSNHPFYLDTRYFKVDPKTTKLTYVANATDASATYKSYSHGVYLRNAHALEALMRPTNFTWRALGGNIDMYIYAGPTQKEITKEYQLSAVGLPAMQQYFTLGYHQCRWGYKNWTQLQEVVDNFKKFQIPLDTIW